VTTPTRTFEAVLTFTVESDGFPTRADIINTLQEIIDQAPEYFQPGQDSPITLSEIS